MQKFTANKTMRSNEDLLNEIEKIVNRKRGFTDCRSEEDVGMEDSPNQLKEGQLMQKSMFRGPSKSIYYKTKVANFSTVLKSNIII